MNKRFKLLIFIILLSLGQTAQACRWCFGDRVKTVVGEALGRQETDKLADFSQPGQAFYDECLVTFYPKAYVIREIYFPIMCPIAIDSALHEVVTVLNEDTWFYFTNKQAGFRWGIYWERIVTISLILANFIQRANVRINDLSVYERSTLFHAMEEDPVQLDPEMSLIEYWRQNGQSAHYDFYAFYFDYVLKLFNEGIKFKDEKKVSEHFFDLETIAEKLQGSRYQTMYEAALERAKRLRLRLREGKRSEPAKGG